VAGAVLALLTTMGGYLSGLHWRPLIDAWPPWSSPTVTLDTPKSSDPLTICAHLSGTAKHLATERRSPLGRGTAKEHQWFFDGRGINVEEDGTWTFDTRLGTRRQ